MDIFESMISLYNQNPSGDMNRNILGVMFKHLYDIPKMTIENAAGLAYTSPSSISRLTRALGFRNFTEFKYELGRSLEGYGFRNQIFPLAELDKTDVKNSYLKKVSNILSFFSQEADLSLIEKAAALIDSSKKISISSFGHILMNIHQLQIDLIVSGKETFYSIVPDEQMEDASTLDENCLAILVVESNHDAYRNLVALTQKLWERKVKIIAIISSNDPIIEQAASLILNYPRDMTASSFLYCYLYLNLITVEYRSAYMRK